MESSHGTQMAHWACRVFLRFDLVANGGASLTLVFERSPFLTQYHTVWIPWNVFYVMDTLVMKKEENDIPSCDLSGFVRPNPIIVSSPLSTFFRSSPEDSPIIPETQVEYSSRQHFQINCFQIMWFPKNVWKGGQHSSAILNNSVEGTIGCVCMHQTGVVSVAYLVLS